MCIALLVAVEFSARRYFTPRYVSEETYASYYPAYDYGFSSDPVCWPIDGERTCLETPYLNIVRQTFPIMKGKRERRVFTIGSSVSRGDGTHAYSNYLEQELAKGSTRFEVRVVNLSASSIGSSRQLIRVREALRYAPDLLVIHPHVANERKDERDRAYSGDLHAGLGGLTLESRAVVALKKYYAERTEMPIPVHAAGEAPDDREDSDENWARWSDTLDENVASMLKLAADRHVPVVLVGFAQNVEGFSSERGTLVNERLKLRAGGSVRYFDMPAVFSRVDAKNAERLFRDHSHLTSVGHRLVARTLAIPIRQLLKL